MLEPVQNNFTDWARDNAFGVLFGYNYFHQLSNGTFLSVSSELDTGFALFVFFFGDMVEILLFIIFITICVPESQTRGVVAEQELIFCPEWPLYQRLKQKTYLLRSSFQE